jgi:diaminopimelate epimerase
MRIAFSKMQGLGNDFVIINAVTQKFIPSLEQCRFISDRRFGIGCDQILLIQPPQNSTTDFYYRIFNQDGSEAEQCGNGARCIASFIHKQGLSNAQEIIIGTLSGDIQLFIESPIQVRVNMGIPRFDPKVIPFIAERMNYKYPLIINDNTVEIGVVSMGNPHAVLHVNELNETQVKNLGALIESHSRFPNKVNVGFMQLINEEHINLRVYERGVGETLACGTGACAAVAVGRSQGLLNETVLVTQPGGDLLINWQGQNYPLWMTGPAVWVFDGEIEI